jgi:hypothetical protein
VPVGRQVDVELDLAFDEVICNIVKNSLNSGVLNMTLARDNPLKVWERAGGLNDLAPGGLAREDLKEYDGDQFLRLERRHDGTSEQHVIQTPPNYGVVCHDLSAELTVLRRSRELGIEHGEWDQRAGPQGDSKRGKLSLPVSCHCQFMSMR